MRRATKNALTFLDLFSGCGGFSLGLERAGFRCLAAIDFDIHAIATFRINFPNVRQVLQRDLTQFGPADLAKVVGVSGVDVIAGGPPCQGFSTARQRDGANHGPLRFIEDDRRQLYREFLKYVGYFKPRVFVMENVLGIQNELGSDTFETPRTEEDALSAAWEKIRHGFLADSRTIEGLEAYTGKVWVRSRRHHTVSSYAVLSWDKLRQQNGLGLRKIRDLVEMFAIAAQA